MTALCFCRNPIPHRSNADGIHFIPIQVKGCHSAQIFFIMADKRANSAQIAKPFFSQIRRKNQTAWKLRLCLMNVFCRHQKHHDIHGIVCDAGAAPDRSVFFDLQRFLQGKHGVQMRRIQNLFFLFRLILPDYISKLIRMNRFHALLFHPFPAVCDSLILFSRFCRGQCQLTQRLQRKLFVVSAKLSVFVFYFPFFTHEVQSFLLCIPILFHIFRSRG